MLKLTVLGTRGSVSVSGDRSSHFGGASSCYMLETEKQALFLDAGTGLLSAPTCFPNPPVILLSHMHMDHLSGLGMYARLSAPGCETKLILPAGTEEEARRLLDTVYGPPFWPCSLTDYAGSLNVSCFRFPMQFGDMRVEGIPGNHPGDAVILKVTAQGKSVVYATDYEREEKSFEALAAFAQGADLLLFDAQFTQADLEKKRGFGHSTAMDGIELMEHSRAKRLLLIHHDPNADDQELFRREREISRQNVRYAASGEVIEL